MDLFQRPSVSLDLPEKLDFGSNDQSVEEESLLPKCDCKKGYSSNFKSPRFALGLKSWLAINLALSVLNLGALLSCVLLWHAGQPAVARQISECLLPPSPAIDVIDKEFRTFPLLSSYTEEPSPEADQMWNELVNLRTMFYLDGEELATVNDCPETAVRCPKGHYVAALAATHQIHCVDSLRKGLYFHYKYYQEKQDPLFAGKHHPPEGHLSKFKNTIGRKVKISLRQISGALPMPAKNGTRLKSGVVLETSLPSLKRWNDRPGCWASIKMLSLIFEPFQGRLLG